MNLAFIQGIGPLELAIVLAILLLVLGPKRLPGLGRSIGSGMRELKDSITRRDAEDDDPDTQMPATLDRPAVTPPAVAHVVVSDGHPVEGEVGAERR